MSRLSAPLARLCSLCGIETYYRDMRGRLRRPSAEALAGVLRAWGVPLRSPREAPAALEQRLQEIRRRVVEPVVVCRRGRGGRVDLRLPPRGGSAPRAILRLEDGSSRRVAIRAGAAQLPASLPAGYHRLEVEAAGRHWETRVICAPARCYEPPGGERREWGLFLPLHALRCEHGWGAGDYSDLEEMVRWTGRLGGRLVGTLPLLPVFLDRPFDPSPYSPVSRLLWGEFWVDPSRAPEMALCARARELAASPAFTREMERLRRGEWVDYRRQMALKRRLLEELARFAFTRAPARRRELERFLRSHPEVEPYARFRAAREKDRGAARYYLYAQWLAHAQVERLRAVSHRSGTRLYLDLPLGAHPAGYDAWRHPEAFASGAGAGAPPDTFFTGGQDWGFRPAHPERARETGYRYAIAAIRHQMSAAGLLRIDHVMGLHRLFWIPRGFPASEGTYVRYRPEEMYAVLALESHRSRCAVVGEDLGLVPGQVRAAMSKHGLRRMFVVQFEMAPGSRRLARRPPRGSLAALNTHDMPPFAAFWKGPAPARALRRFLRLLASGPARTLLVNLEDLWGETRPQNVPGTYRERPNWRRKARWGLREFRRLPAVKATLEEIRRLRKNRAQR